MTSSATTSFKPISADSHVTEPPHCYTKYIDPQFRDRAPAVKPDPKRGFVYTIDGLQGGIGMGTLAAAGKDPKEIKTDGATWDDLHRGGWDPKARLADQDRDGVGAEVIFPSIGMVLCGHEDAAYKRACMQAYNRWLKEEFVSFAPDRLIGVGQAAVRDIAETIQDIHDIKAMGFKSVMMPLFPATGFDYDDPRFDPVWKTAVELDMPLSFHISSGGNKKDKDGNFLAQRGPTLGVWIGVIRHVQDIIGMMIFSGVFDRVPGLKVVLVESDAGWAPHMIYRMDHAYNRHRFWMKGTELKHMPSEYWQENVSLTFQDDWTAFKMVAAGLMNPKTVMWANDFPHSDATWPWSQELLAEHATGLTDEQRKLILRDNAVRVFHIPVAA